MAEEEKLAENKEEEAKSAEAKIEPVVEEKKAEPAVRTEYKPTDYEYKSWSSGRADIPEGWERCPEYPDVIRRLKVATHKPEEPAAEAISPKLDGKGHCGCCH